MDYSPSDKYGLYIVSLLRRNFYCLLEVCSSSRSFLLQPGTSKVGNEFLQYPTVPKYLV